MIFDNPSHTHVAEAHAATEAEKLSCGNYTTEFQHLVADTDGGCAMLLPLAWLK